MCSVYLIMSNDGQRTIVKSVIKSIEKANQTFDMLDHFYSKDLIREQTSPTSITYYKLIDGVKRFYQQLYVERKKLNWVRWW